MAESELGKWMETLIDTILIQPFIQLCYKNFVAFFSLHLNHHAKTEEAKPEATVEKGPGRGFG